MKKVIKTFVSIILCCSVIMTSGCASDPRSGSAPVSGSDTGSVIPNVSDTDPVSYPDARFDLVPISEIRENFSQITDELRESEFVNLDFSKAEFGFPEIDSISKLSLSVPTGKSPRELYDFYCESLETLLPGVYSDEGKFDLMEFIYWNYDTNERHNLTIDEYELINDDEYEPPILFTDKKCFMQGLWGTVEWFAADDLNRWLGKEGSPLLSSLGDDLYYKDEIHTVDYIPDPENCTDKYELINGEISVKDAAEFVNNFLETTVFSPYEQDAKTKLLAADVVDIGNGKYGYGFLTVYEYNNVLFDYPEMNEVDRGHLVPNDYDDRRYSYHTGDVSMIQTDKVFHFMVPVFGKSIEEVETYTSAITLRDAANIISEFFSNYMNFTVTRVEAVYLTYEQTSVPCWKFTMRCSGDVYNTFVDMQTGEVHLYIQRGE